jgi:hypothetical protein
LKAAAGERCAGLWAVGEDKAGLAIVAGIRLRHFHGGRWSHRRARVKQDRALRDSVVHVLDEVGAQYVSSSGWAVLDEQFDLIPVRVRAKDREPPRLSWIEVRQCGQVTPPDVPR